MCRLESKNVRKNRVCKKDYIWNPRTCSCENGKDLESIIGDSVITCDEITEVTKNKSASAKTAPTKNVPTKTIPTNLNEKR